MPAPVSQPHTPERVNRVAGLVGQHTVRIYDVALQVRAGKLSPQDALDRIGTLCQRTVVALLACVHEDGPP